MSTKEDIHLLLDMIEWMKDGKQLQDEDYTTLERVRAQYDYKLNPDVLAGENILRAQGVNFPPGHANE